MGERGATAPVSCGTSTAERQGPRWSARLTGICAAYGTGPVALAGEIWNALWAGLPPDTRLSQLGPGVGLGTSGELGVTCSSCYTLAEAGDALALTKCHDSSDHGG